MTGDTIAAVGPSLPVPAGARRVDLPGATLIPGMTEGHGHLFLHPYDEASWDDQVLHEPLALRTARAVANAKATLLAGFTSERDLGTEGAGYADVPGFARAAGHDAVAGHGYVLTPGRYVGAEEAEADAVPFPERFAALRATLDEQFAQSARLTEVIRERLAGVIVPTE